MIKSANQPLYLDNKDGNTFKFLLNELKPKGKIFTPPFNIISIPVIITGIIIMYIRFTQGIGSVTNLSQEVPWGGLWIGFDVVTGVAFAGGAMYLFLWSIFLTSKNTGPLSG